MSKPQDVLRYWFGDHANTVDQPDTGESESAMMSSHAGIWFRKSEETDREIRVRFQSDIVQCLAGDHDDWLTTPEGTVAFILVLDQFTRNVYRDTARMYVGDELVRWVTRRALAAENHAKWPRIWRMFSYMPLEHSEWLPFQEECVHLVSALAAEAPDQTRKTYESFADYAVKHRDVIQQFGRFPHRNALLGRPSTAEEQAYLAKPGAGF